MNMKGWNPDMRMSQLIGLAALLAACGPDRPLATEPAVSNTSPPAFASANATLTFREPLTFTLTPAQCSELTTTVTGTGVSHVVVHESPDGSGGIHFSFSNTVNGTATGEDGSFYRFSYQLNERTTKEAVPPFTVAIVDKFLLIGAGKTQNVAVKFYNEFVVNPDGSFTDIKFTVRGELGCDAI
jgi:hypothetical protein